MGTLPPEIGRKEALQDLEEISRVFEKYKVPLFLTYGALLGIVRDGDFIPYDDDIDLCITEKIDYQTRKAIGNTLLDIGYGPQPISFRVFDRLEASEPGYNGDAHSGIIVCQKRIRTTLFFFGQEDCPIHGSCMVCHPKLGSGRLISTPAHFFEKPDIIKFKGKKYLTPSPVKEYLEFMYGDTWKQPIKGKHAPQWGPSHPGLPNDPHMQI
jgi:hypothetical protein